VTTAIDQRIGRSENSPAITRLHNSRGWLGVRVKLLHRQLLSLLVVVLSLRKEHLRLFAFR
jgi:hypothetical protein